jgi:hypothetical protein
MNKAQHLYNYLIKSGLLTEEELDVWVEEGEVEAPPVYDGSPNLAYLDKYQINGYIQNFPIKTRDLRKVKFALLWWMNVYQPERGKTAFGWEADNLNTETTNVWFGLQVTEKTLLKDGEVTTCIQPSVLLDPLYADVPVWLHDARSGEETLMQDALDE